MTCSPFVSTLLFFSCGAFALRAAEGPGPWLDPERGERAGMRYEIFSSKLAHTDVSYAIHLPPGYAEETTRRYPVVYWLHGRGGSQWGAATFATRLATANSAKKAPPMIVGVDWFDGRVPGQRVIIKELVPHIDATCRTIALREGRAIEGFSMGGAGAPKIGFKNPELFGVIGVIAGALHDLASYSSRGTAFQDIYGGSKEYFEANDAWNVLEKNAGAIRGRTFVRVAVGASVALARARQARASSELRETIRARASAAPTG